MAKAKLQQKSSTIKATKDAELTSSSRSRKSKSQLRDRDLELSRPESQDSDDSEGFDESDGSDEITVTKKSSKAPANAFSFLSGDEDDEDEEAEDIEDEGVETNVVESITKKVSKLKTDKSPKESPKMSPAVKLDRKQRKTQKLERMAKAHQEKKKLAREQEEEEEMEDEQDNAYDKLKRFSSYASGQQTPLIDKNSASGITVTGNLLSAPNSKDLQLEKVTLAAYGKTLIKESDFSLINGRRYGLIAPNGSGKSTLLHAIACGIVPMPESLDYYLLDREYLPTELTCVEAVLDIFEREKRYLEAEMERLLDDPDKHAVRLDSIVNRIGELEAESSEHKVRKILKGLQFSDEMIEKKTRDLSGGWRMRIALARILFVMPTLIMLDEPTNHLDLEAVAWLEEYLVNELNGHTLVITCHTQDTLNEVCTDIIHLHNQRLDFYSGNYDTFVKVREEKDTMLQKKAKRKETDMSKLQNKLNMTGSDQQKQAKAKLKAMEKKAEKDKQKNATLEEELVVAKDLKIVFQNCGGGMPSPVIKFSDVSFNYPDQDFIFKDLNFGIGLDSRIALVGPNGAGKTTLINLIRKKFDPSNGVVSHHQGLRIALFHQHMQDQLDLKLSAVEWLHTKFGDKQPGELRAIIGRYGLTGKSQVIPMAQLSDGQRRRVLFCYLGIRQPHVLLLDEPTNALDISTIDALADAINNFDGGVVMISHDLRLIEKTAEEIWLVGRQSVKNLPGDIRDYKQLLKDKIRQERLEEQRRDLLSLAEDSAKPKTVIGLR